MRLVRQALAMMLLCVAVSLPAVAEDQNTTGLPTYAHTTEDKMDATYRSLPNGQHCIHYSATSADPLATVEAWYRKQLPGAKVDDVNHKSLYGGYFKLDGIQLFNGTDIVTVYRMANQSTTSIELFKCRDALAH